MADSRVATSCSADEVRNNHDYEAPSGSSVIFSVFAFTSFLALSSGLLRPVRFKLPHLPLSGGCVQPTIRVSIPPKFRCFGIVSFTHAMARLIRCSAFATEAHVVSRGQRHALHFRRDVSRPVLIRSSHSLTHSQIPDSAVSFAATRFRHQRRGLLEIRRSMQMAHPITPTEDNAVTRAVSSGGETAHPPGAQRPSTPLFCSRG